jgi:hypothetical protein
MRFFHRQNLLFLGAVLLPSVLLVALGIRMVRQEEELVEKRLREQHGMAIDLVRRELLARLQTYKTGRGDHRAVCRIARPRLRRQSDPALVRRSSFARRFVLSRAVSRPGSHPVGTAAVGG